MAYLVILDGSRSGEHIQLSSSEVSIGRAAGNTVSLDGPAISGNHCLIRHQGERYIVIDLDSTNGTSVNDEPISEHEIRRGDILTLGTTPLRVEGDDLAQGDNPEAAPAATDVPAETEAPTATESAPDETEAAPRAATRRVNIQPRTRKEMPAVPQMKDFEKKRDSKRIWIVVLSFLALLILGALAWLIKEMIGS